MADKQYVIGKFLLLLFFVCLFPKEKKSPKIFNFGDIQKNSQKIESIKRSSAFG